MYYVMDSTGGVRALWKEYKLQAGERWLTPAEVLALNLTPGA